MGVRKMLEKRKQKKQAEKIQGMVLREKYDRVSNEPREMGDADRLRVLTKLQKVLKDRNEKLGRNKKGNLLEIVQKAANEYGLKGEGVLNHGYIKAKNSLSNKELLVNDLEYFDWKSVKDHPNPLNKMKHKILKLAWQVEFLDEKLEEARQGKSRHQILEEVNKVGIKFKKKPHKTSFKQKLEEAAKQNES
jgi:hypothetical protein